jgi:hypothetical protein
MKKLLLIGSIVLVIGLLIAGFTTPIFAHGPEDGEATPANEGAWEEMHEACENGDWEAMTKAAEEVHEGEFDDMPYHGGRMWGHMGRGMMGGMY